MKQSSLSRSPRMIAWRKRIKPILYDVEVTCRKRYRRKVIQGMKDGVKLVSGVGIHHFFDGAAQFRQRPAINLLNLFIRHAVSRWNETIKITQGKTRCVA